MKNILILGYFGAGNVGDELMLYQYLLNRSTSDTYYVHYRDNVFRNSVIEGWQNVKGVNQGFINKNWNLFTDVVVCGGCHFYNNRDTNVLDNCIIAIKKSIKVKVISVSTVCAITNKCTIEKIKFVVSKSFYFSVRDPYSLNFFVSIGCDKNKIKLDKDILYDYDFNSIKDINEVKNKKNLCFVPFIWSEYTQNFYRNIMNELINYCSLHDLKLIVLNFWAHFSNKIVDNFDFKDVEHKIIKDIKDLNYVLSIIKNADVLVSEKYHASLISMELKISTISISPNVDHYPFKMKYLHEYKQNNHLLYTRCYKNGDIQKELDKLLNE